MPFELPDLKIHDIYDALIIDKHRNELIFNDLRNALRMGRSPLLLTERTEHITQITDCLKDFVTNIIVFRGGMGIKQRTALADQMQSIPDGEERLIIATGRYIGEGLFLSSACTI